jgi:hypothetical protein
MRTLAMCGCIIALATLAQGQSLGEVAERTREQRKGGDAAKTLTQEDLDRAAAAREASAPIETAPDASSTESPTMASRAPVARLQRSPDAARATEPPMSDMAILEQKIQKWRARYSPVQARVEALEQQVGMLAEEDSRAPLISVTSSCRRGRTISANASVHSRLTQARAELAKQQQQLETIVEQARLDGVTSGQLY